MAKGAVPYRKPTKKELLEVEVKKNQKLAMKTLGTLQHIDPTRIGKTFDEDLKKKKARKGFPNSICRAVLLKQKLLCNICKKFYKTWDFDHIDEDPSNNAQSNCQALCRNCHGEKSRKNRN